MEWNDRYAIGIEQIDEQHKGLFRMVNRMAKIVQDGDFSRDQRACIEALVYLKRYTFIHFQDEEAYQLAIHYPQYEAHKKIHDDFRQLILDYEQRFADGQMTYDQVMELLNVLTRWLVTHIAHQDRLIAEFQRAQEREGA